MIVVFRVVEELEVLPQLGVASVATEEKARAILESFHQADTVLQTADFKHKEPVWSQRIVITANLIDVFDKATGSDVFGSPTKGGGGSRHSKQQHLAGMRQVLSEEYCEMCLQLSREARKNNYLHVAQWALGNLDHFLEKQKQKGKSYIHANQPKETGNCLKPKVHFFFSLFEHF